MKSYRSRAALLASVLFAVACSGGVATPPSPVAPTVPPPPPIRLAQVGDSVMYLERTNSLTLIDRPTDTLRVEAHHTAVIHVMRTAPDTLEAFYEHLMLEFESPTRERRLDTSTLIGPRFVLHEDDGRIETVRMPEQPQEMRQLTDLSRQFDDFFLRLPDSPLAIGTEWVDTVHFADSEGESSAERSMVTRYRVTGDSTLFDIPALVVEYDAVVENRVRTPPSTQGTLTSTLVGEEEGRFVYSPERGIMLGRSRIGVLEGEIVVDGPLETLRFPQAFSYDSTIELLPPPGTTDRPRPAREPLPEPVPER